MLAIDVEWGLPIIALLLFTIYFGYAKTNFEYHNLRARAFLDRSMYEAVLEETRLGRTPLVTISHSLYRSAISCRSAR